MSKSGSSITYGYNYIQRLIVEKLAFPDIIIIFTHITEVAATSIIFSHR